MVKFPSPIGASEEDAEWIADQPGINFDAALLAGTLGLARRAFAWRETAKFGAGIARRPRRAARPLGKLAGDAAKIATGRSPIEPARRDRRYADRAWKDNAIFKGIAQGHAALALAIDELLNAAELDPADDYRLRLIAINLIEALAPANWPWSNPAAWKAVIDSGGGSLVTGAQRLADDVSRPPRLPIRSEAGQFKLGEEVAATPGAVVLRTPVMELIQYDPATPEVKAEPVLFVPSLVNKYYLTDLSPGRSLVEYAVKHGVQAFHISWVNPDVSHRDFDLDTYVAAIVEALDTVRAITGSEQAHTRRRVRRRPAADDRAGAPGRARPPGRGRELHADRLRARPLRARQPDRHDGPRRPPSRPRSASSRTGSSTAAGCRPRSRGCARSTASGGRGCSATC